MKRTLKRKTKQPHTSVPNYGMNKVITKIDKLLKIWENRR